jgi:hypothetical protein
MDFSSNIDLIIRDLTEVCEIIDDLKNYPGVPAFQVEIAKSKCRSAAGLIALLKNLKDIDDPVKEKTIVTSPVIEKITGEVKKTPPVSEVNVTIPDIPVFELSNDIVVATDEETVIKEDIKISEPLKEKKTVEEIKITDTRDIKTIKAEKHGRTEPEKIQEKTSGQSIIADRFSPVSGSVYEQIGKVAASDELSEIILAKPVASLTDAIGVNDRFLFIRELFKGDKEAYLKAIERLDNTSNYSEAHSIVMSLAENGEENEAVRNMLMVIKRKHPSNE